MALTTEVSSKELQRVAVEAYETKTLKVMLCSAGATGYTAESTVADWQTVEKSGNGYVRYSEVISTGSYDTVNGRYAMPSIDADFTATSSSYTYDRIVLYIDGETYPHSVITESPNNIISPGQISTYRLNLITDD